MSKIGIVYMATSVYKDYFPTFLSTANRLFPNDDKTLIVISDGLSYFNKKEFNGIKIIIHKVMDMPYPMLPACKFRFVTTLTKKHSFDYILFFDSDTIIFNKTDEYWESLKSLMYDGHLIMSKHPHYLYNPDLVLSDLFIVKNEQSCGYLSDDCINQNKSYIITSFFGGKYDVIKKYDDMIYKMIGYDLHMLRWMPEYVDEAYMNYIYIQENVIQELDTIHLDTYITINPYTFPATIENMSTDDRHANNFKDNDMIFMNQKFDAEMKNRKKHNIV